MPAGSFRLQREAPALAFGVHHLLSKTATTTELQLSILFATPKNTGVVYGHKQPLSRPHKHAAKNNRREKARFVAECIGTVNLETELQRDTGSNDMAVSWWLFSKNVVLYRNHRDG